MAQKLHPILDIAKKGGMMALDMDYFEYLLYLMRFDTPEHRHFRCLMDDLYDIPFIIKHPMDENRVIDAEDMKKEFLFDHGYDVDSEFTSRDISILEVLVALSRRIEIEVTGEPGNDHIERWFWEMLYNLGVLLKDNIYDRGLVRYKLDVWMLRQYKSNGIGSVFPLKSTKTDQRENDLWYQGQLYLSENFEY